MEPAAFIVLLILRSLDTANSAVVPRSLTSKLIPLLAKREIKVRRGCTARRHVFNVHP